MFRKQREKEATSRGNTWNSVSKIDNIARYKIKNKQTT
jgi:hypothetical protein